MFFRLNYSETASGFQPERASEAPYISVIFRLFAKYPEVPALLNEHGIYAIFTMLKYANNLIGGISCQYLKAHASSDSPAVRLRS